MLSHSSSSIVLRPLVRLLLAVVASMLSAWAGTGHAAFIDPTSISGNLLWLDGADATTITADADGINQWSDKSPQSNHATLAAGGTQHPSHELAVVNGNSIVRFDGNDYLNLTTTLSMQSVFAVVKQTSGTGLQRIFDGGPGGVGAVDGLTTLSGNYGIRFSSGTDTVIGSVTSSFRIIGGAANGSSTYTVLDGAVTGQTADSFNTSLNYALGRPFAFDGQYLVGDIAELIVYNRILTDGSQSEFDDELNDVLFYLQEKWGVDAGLSATPVQPVPEPSTLLLLGLGLGLGAPWCLGRNRRQRSAGA